MKLKDLTARLRQPANRSHLIWMVVIFAVALVLRSLWVAYAPADPGDGRNLDDTHLYFGSAVQLAAGHGYVRPFSLAPTAYWPPGYTFLLAGLFRVFGSHVEVTWIANIILGTLTCAALYVVGNLIGGKKVGILAGLLLAIFPGHIFFSSLVLSETLFTFLVVITMALMLLAVRKSDAGWLWIILSGVLVGAAALVRGQGLFLLPTAAFFWWVFTADLMRALKWTAVTALACTAVIMPWTVRNYVTMGSFVFISTNSGSNLYMGHHEGASGSFDWGASRWTEERYAYLPPERQEVKSSNLAMREGLRFMFTHPGEEARLVGSKLRYLYENDVEALDWIEAPEVGKTLDHRPLWAGIANGFYFTVLALSAGGLIRWLQRPRSDVALPLILVILFTLGQMLFFAIPRFHVPMLPSFCLLAAAGLIAGTEYLQSRSRLSRAI